MHSWPDRVGDAAVDPASGVLRHARQVPSPNCDARPPGTVVDLIVVHGISLPPGRFGGPWIDALFTNTLDPDAHPFFGTVHALRVSAHLLIRRDGAVAQYVPFVRRAWHAGRSTFQGRARCNDFSVGIELEGADDVPYAAAQYRRLGQVARGLMKAYPAITAQRVAGHAEVAPGRKTDPGAAFDWPRLRAELARPGG